MQSKTAVFTFADGETVLGRELHRLIAVLDALATSVDVHVNGPSVVLTVHYREDFEADRLGHEL